MRHKTSLLARAIEVLGIFLLFVGVFCDKQNPVSNDNVGPVTDADGNVYHTIKIGNQVWTLENLRTTKYNDGTPIIFATTGGIGVTSIWNGLYYYYNNTSNADSINRFGALYNRSAVNTGKLAPKGWHVPTSAEWNALQKYLIANGYNYNGIIDSNKIAKSLAAKTDWLSDTTPGAIGNDLITNDSSGFSALPGGFLTYQGLFSGIGEYGYWWSATTTADDAYCSVYYVLYYNYSLLGSGGSDLGRGGALSVRLLRDN